MAASLTPPASEALKTLGGFVPTLNPAARTVKGWMTDEEGYATKVWFTSAELYELGTGLIEAADFLDARAEEAR